MASLIVSKAIQASDATPLDAEKIVKSCGFRYQAGSVVEDGGRTYRETNDIVFFVKYRVDGEEFPRELTEPADKEDAAELEARALKAIEKAHGLGVKNEEP